MDSSFFVTYSPKMNKNFSAHLYMSHEHYIRYFKTLNNRSGVSRSKSKSSKFLYHRRVTLNNLEVCYIYNSIQRYNHSWKTIVLNFNNWIDWCGKSYVFLSIFYMFFFHFLTEKRRKNGQFKFRQFQGLWSFQHRENSVVFTVVVVRPYLENNYF